MGQRGPTPCPHLRLQRLTQVILVTLDVNKQHESVLSSSLVGDPLYSRWVDDVGIYQHAVEKV